MNSKERHEVRYQRRHQKRIDKFNEIANKSFNEVFNYDNLLDAGYKACKGVRWKTSTILFENDIVNNVAGMYNELRGITKRKFKGFHSFKTIEHGKMRDIDAISIWDRTQQKCFNNNYLTPLYSRSFIRDNAASVKGGGVEFTIKRLKHNLVWHYKHYGQTGGILLFDFKDYFKSISHAYIKRTSALRMKDDNLRLTFNQWIDDFNLLSTNIEPEVGIGLGSEVSQLIALDHVSPIDHYFKDRISIHGYARYMDDGYLISNNLEFLNACLDELIYQANKLDLTISLNKCMIIPFTNNNFFTFLKFRICLQDNGKIIILPNKKSSIRERSKLRKLKIRIDNKKACPIDAWNSASAWISHLKLCTNRKLVEYKMVKYFYELYKNYINHVIDIGTYRGSKI